MSVENVQRRQLKGNVMTYNGASPDDRAFQISAHNQSRHVAQPHSGQRRLCLESLERRDLLAGIPIISEFMAKNDGFFEDGDGNAPDWIEIQNVGDQTLDLAGYHLTDKPRNLTRWTFPNVTVEAGAYLVVFASGQETDDYVDAQGNLHTNFSLSSNGEYLALVDPHGMIVSQLGDSIYPAQHSNLSYGVAQKENWVLEQSDVFYWAPSDGMVDEVWNQPGFDALGHGFLQGKAALGYERGSLASIYSFQDEFTTPLPDESFSVYARIEFELQDVSDIHALSLRMRYDDGFIAYLNGVQVASANAPDTGGLDVASDKPP